MSVLINGMSLPDKDHLVLVEIDSGGSVFSAYDGGRTKLESFSAVQISSNKQCDLTDAIESVRFLISGNCTDTQADYIEEIEEVLRAAEKQIPRKPLGEHYAHMRCPACNHRIPSGGGSSSRRADRWCNYCGQAIDWETGRKNG